MKLILNVVVLVVVFLIAIRYVERHSIYFPMKDVFSNPSSIGLAYEDVYFSTRDGKSLNGWFIPRDAAKSTVILLHGNAGNIGHRLEKIKIFNDLGLNVFVFDYRGYGKSLGAPSESGFYKDAEAACDYLTKERGIQQDEIILYGESIGGAVAIHLTKEKDIRALITEEAFTSIKDMSALAFPFIPHFIFSSKFDSVSKIKAIACPKLIIHSVDDEIVPFWMGKRLFDEAAPPKVFLEIRGSHNTAFLDSKEKFRVGLRSFLNSLEVTRPQKPPFALDTSENIWDT